LSYVQKAFELVPWVGDMGRYQRFNQRDEIFIPYPHITKLKISFWP